MSVVARQGIKYSIVGYLGFLIGTFSAAFVFPHDFEFYGKLRYILTTAEMLVPVVIFGISYANIKFFHQTQKDGKNQNMMSWSLLAMVVNFLIFVVGFFVAASLFPSIKSLELWSLKIIILLLILLLALSAIFNKYISNFKRIVVPNIFENLFPKIANLVAFCLVFFLIFPEKVALIVFFGFFVLSFLGYVFYANKLDPIKLDFSTDYFKKNDFYKLFLNYSFFGFLGTFANYLAINNFMVGEFLGMEELGVYSTLYALISLISIPQLGLFNVSAPIINKCLAENEMEELDFFHKKTSLSLYFLGVVLFSCIVVGFPYLTTFIKNGQLLFENQPVIWIWGFAVLFDLATGFNGNIISLSKYYRFNIVVMLLLAFLSIFLNYYFINHTDLKLVGIAISTAIALSLYNLIKIIFNYQKFGVYPLSIEMIYASIIGTIAISVAILLPDFSSNLLNLLYKPALVIVLFLVGNYFLKIFPIEQYLNKNFFKSLLKF